MTRIPDRTLVVEAGPMKVFSLLTADPNPIHWDAERPVNQGGLNVGYVIGAVSDWAGSSAAIREVRVRFHGTVLAGSNEARPQWMGEVDEVRGGLAHLRVWLRDEHGTDLLTGTATVETEAAG